MRGGVEERKEKKTFKYVHPYPLLYRLVVAEHLGLPEHGVDERGLAVVDVRDDGDVADVHAEFGGEVARRGCGCGGGWGRRGVGDGGDRDRAASRGCAFF